MGTCSAEGWMLRSRRRQRPGRMHTTSTSTPASRRPRTHFADRIDSGAASGGYAYETTSTRSGIDGLEPLVRATQTVGHRHRGLVPEDRPRPDDVAAPAHRAVPAPAARDGDAGVAADHLVDLRGQVGDPRLDAAREVERVPGRRRSVDGEEEAVDDVTDEGEVARLVTRAGDGQGLASPRALDEVRDHVAVGPGPLPR